MIDFNNYIIWVAVAALLLGTFILWKLMSRRKRRSSQSKFIIDTLTEAKNQNFDLRLATGTGKTGLTALLDSFANNSLILQAHGMVTESWENQPIEVFFRVIQNGTPVSFVFDSKITRINATAESSTLTMPMPMHLRVEKKRHFDRIHPNPKDILMIAVWPAPPGKRLPRANGDLGVPPVSWKNGQSNPAVQLDNIAGSGIALRFAPGQDGKFPLTTVKGKHLICLIVFKPNQQERVIFWCTGEIMNIRQDGYAIAAGLEFINWAVQEHGSSEIHWTHNSPWRGVKPILQWVQQLEKAK